MVLALEFGRETAGMLGRLLTFLVGLLLGLCAFVAARGMEYIGYDRAENDGHCLCP